MRVEGFSKISATLRPASTREESGAAFSSAARVEQPVELGGAQLRPGEEVPRGDVGRTGIRAGRAERGRGVGEGVGAPWERQSRLG